MTKRKPPASSGNGESPTAYDVLNAFLKEKNIALGLSKPTISFTDSNQIIINPPQIIAIYKHDTKMEEKKV